MLPSLCRAMAANPFVSRFLGPSGGGWPRRQRFSLGFRAASWQHRYLDCGTLILSGRCGRGTNVALPAGCRQEGAASGRRLHGR
jgi:hypothetical protein